MADIKIVYGSESVLYSTDVYGGTDADVGSSEVFTGDVDLETNGYQGALLVVKGTFVASPTDDLEVRVYGSLDGNYNGNENPVLAYTLEKVDGGENIMQTVPIFTVPHFRIGLKSSGTTDTIDAKVTVKPFYYQSV